MGWARCLNERQQMGHLKNRMAKRIALGSVGGQTRLWKDGIVGQQEATWTVTSMDRERYKTLAEGYVLQWKGNIVGQNRIE